MGKCVESGVKMMTAEPLGRALRAALSANQQYKPSEGWKSRTSLRITSVALGESTERQVEAFVHVPDVLLEVRLDLGELEVS